MNLTPEDRSEIVKDLTSNCDSWKFEKSEELLNNMSDEQLLAIGIQNNVLNEAAFAINQIRKDFELPEDMALNALPEALSEIVANAAAFDRSGEAGAEAKRANGKEGDEYEEDEGSEMESSEGEGEYAGDTGETGVSNQKSNSKKPSKDRRKPMTVNQWLATAPPEVQVVVRNAMQRDAEDKDNFIQEIVANVNNPYTDEMLQSMTTEQLRPLAQLARQPVRNRANASANPRYPVANYYGASTPVNNAAKKSEYSTDDLLIPPVINWKENAEALRENRL